MSCTTMHGSTNVKFIEPAVNVSEASVSEYQADRLRKTHVVGVRFYKQTTS